MFFFIVVFECEFVFGVVFEVVVKGQGDFWEIVVVVQWMDVVIYSCEFVEEFVEQVVVVFDGLFQSLMCLVFIMFVCLIIYWSYQVDEMLYMIGLIVDGLGVMFDCIVVCYDCFNCILFLGMD